MTSLFDYADSYPIAPGWKDPDTSKAAAESMKPVAAYLHAKCLRALRDRGPSTADEIAEAVGETVLSCRPRFTKMLAMGEIRDTGDRRRNSSGRSAKVWIAL